MKNETAFNGTIEDILLKKFENVPHFKKNKNTLLKIASQNKQTMEIVASVVGESIKKHLFLIETYMPAPLYIGNDPRINDENFPPTEDEEVKIKIIKTKLPLKEPTKNNSAISLRKMLRWCTSQNRYGRNADLCVTTLDDFITIDGIKYYPLVSRSDREDYFVHLASFKELREEEEDGSSTIVLAAQKL